MALSFAGLVEAGPGRDGVVEGGVEPVQHVHELHLQQPPQPRVSSVLLLRGEAGADQDPVEAQDIGGQRRREIWKKGS